MQHFLYIFVSTFLLQCNLTSAQEKDGVPKKYDPTTGYEIKEFKANDAVFEYTLNALADTTKIWTRDPIFHTPENYKVGSKLKELPKTLQAKALKIAGFGYRIELNSCWYLFFCEGDSCTDRPLSPDSEVKWIQKNR